MAFFDGVIYSKTLQIDTRLAVILPHDSREARVDAPAQKAKNATQRTLILLHGLSDNAAAWWMRTSIIRYAEAHGIAVLMPQGEKSFYHDMVFGDDYFSYLTQELPQLASQMFGLSVSPKDLMIAGLSMGGYGAMKCAMTYPERFLACAAFSSACDIREIAANAEVIEQTKGIHQTFESIFGVPIFVPETSDLFSLAEQNAERMCHLQLYMACGRQDFLYESNVRLSNVMREKPLGRFLFEEWDGTHEWGFWDKAISRTLDWIE
jgi:putative tributyrin esterase